MVGRKFAPTLIRVLAPDELRPSVTGDLRLIDSETDEAREITVTAGALANYQRRLRAHRAWLEEITAHFGVNYIETASDEPFEGLILRYLKARRVIQ
jgi:uncharacterized protein (DUF58 family)